MSITKDILLQICKPIKFIIHAHGSNDVYDNPIPSFILPPNAYLITTSALGELAYVEASRVEARFNTHELFKNFNTSMESMSNLPAIEKLTTNSRTKIQFNNHEPGMPINNTSLSGTYTGDGFVPDSMGWWKEGCKESSNPREHVRITHERRLLSDVINEITSLYPSDICVIMLITCRDNGRDKWIRSFINTKWNSLQLIGRRDIDYTDVNTVYDVIRSTIYARFNADSPRDGIILRRHEIPTTIEMFSIARALIYLHENHMPYNKLNLMFALSVLPTNRSDELGRTPRAIHATPSPRSNAGNIYTPTIVNGIIRRLCDTFISIGYMRDDNTLLDHFKQYHVPLKVSTQLIPLISECIPKAHSMSTTPESVCRCIIDKLDANPGFFDLINSTAGSYNGGRNRNKRSKGKRSKGKCKNKRTRIKGKSKSKNN
jgi:hypothetical protein